MRLILISILYIFFQNSFAQDFNSQEIFSNDDNVPMLGNKPDNSFNLFSADNGVGQYQIGQVWDKYPVNQQMLSSSPVVHQLAAQTGKIRRATGFYLGKFADKHIFATNYHVCSNYFRCAYHKVHFDVLNVEIDVDTLVGSWKEIDLALLTLEVPAHLEPDFAAIAQNFDFDFPIQQGMALTTTGYGIANNNDQHMTIALSEECKVFSDSFNLMQDPDQIHTSSYNVWSFAIGCDISHGDSGSLIADFNTGKIVGIAWTGKVPKRPAVQQNTTLDNAIRTNDEQLIWNELNYAVPAAKIKETLIYELNYSNFSPWQKQVLLDFLF